MKGRVIKNIADKFSVVAGGVVYENCIARGNLKQNGKVLVGDIVECEIVQDGLVIVKIEKRKNEFIRPPISNIDVMLIVISEVPSPDFLLVDKLVLNCKVKNVTPIIVINKEDLISTTFVDSVREFYKDSGIDVILVSALTSFGKSQLLNLIKGKVVCLVGQSAVGKSSLLNMIFKINTKTDEISKKSNRGKNTTRHAQIHFTKSDDLYLADTAGFSKFDTLEIPYNKIELYYDEFDKYRDLCKYKPCSHIFEKDCDCAVKNALKTCNINKNRYNNYKEIYLIVKKNWENRYE